MTTAQRPLGGNPTFRITKSEVRANEIAFLLAGLHILVLALLIRAMLNRPDGHSPLFRIESENRGSSLQKTKTEALKDAVISRTAAESPSGRDPRAARRLDPITFIETMSAHVAGDPRPRLETLSPEAAKEGPRAQNAWVETISIAASGPVSHAGLPQPNPQVLEKISSALISLQNLSNPSDAASPAPKLLALAAPSSSGLAYTAQRISDSLPPGAQAGYHESIQREAEVQGVSRTVFSNFFIMLSGDSGGGCIPNADFSNDCSPADPAGNRAHGADPVPNRDTRTDPVNNRAVSAPPLNNNEIAGAGPPSNNAPPDAGPTMHWAPDPSPPSAPGTGPSGSAPGPSPGGGTPDSNLPDSGPFAWLEPQNPSQPLPGEDPPGPGSGGSGPFSRALASLQEGENHLTSTEGEVARTDNLASAAGDKLTSSEALGDQIRNSELTQEGNAYQVTTANPNDPSAQLQLQLARNNAMARL